MSVFLALFAGLGTFCVLILFIEYSDHWIAKTFPGEVEMPTPDPPYPANHQPRVRVVQTYEGDSLASGITRAMILAMEYKVVVLIHDWTCVVVFPGSEVEDIAAEWHATRKVQDKLAGCAAKDGGRLQ